MNRKIAKKLLIFLACVSLGFTFTACCGGIDENNTYMDLSEYFGLNQAEGKQNLAVVIDNSIVGYGIIEEDKSVYLPYDVIRQYINNKFYVDYNEDLLIYTTPDSIIDSSIGTNKYGNGTDFDKTISIKDGKNIYISLDYVILMENNINFELFDSPDRLVIRTALNYTIANASDDGKVRFEPDVMSEILFDVKKSDKLYLIEGEGLRGYTKVANNSGVVGYIQDELVSNKEEILDEPSFTPVEYSHTIRDYKICLGWHQMESVGGNDGLYEAMSNATSLNVISPTWYQISDSEGNFSSCASIDYVNRAHKEGIEVWALISDFNYDEENSVYFINTVLASTTSRRNLISNLIDEAKQLGFDGINIDFEKIGYDYAYDYVEFIRELSIQCRELGIVLSVDMYVPIESNKYYDRTSVGEAADYVIVMGYDEHWAGCGSAGSTASIQFVRNGIANTISEVDPSRVINAIPFYTRVWSETPEDIADADDEIIEDNIFGNYALNSYAVGLNSAKNVLSSHNVTPVWLEEVGQYYGEYKENDITYRVWLEEYESTSLKLKAMEEYKIGGVACWKLGLDNAEVWTAISEYLSNDTKE